LLGLLPLLKSIHKPSHLRNFAGQTLGVDAYGWLHRGTVSCAIELAEQKPTRKHIDFALSRVRMLLHFGVKPYLVFDGDYLPSKEHTEKERAARRKESKRLGLELLRMRQTSQAYLELQKAIDVTPSMARELIEELKALDVPYVVAPYEADSQLAYLEKRGHIKGVLSEDSDLLVFGVKCLLTKLDQYGECVMVNQADFTACREVSLVGWSDKEFRMMAMLSGCDYLPGIERMGLKTAYRLVRKHKTFERVIRSVQFDGKMKVPPKYLEAFTQAERTFLYQWVFCPAARSLVNLNEIPAGLDVETMPYIGKNVEPEVAAGVASGDLDPNTKQPLAFNRSSRATTTLGRIAQTPDEKQGKPITEFFKAKRTPLAELDPNSFTPSPSQQRLLQSQQNTSWSASQNGRAPLLESVASSRRVSAPQQSTRALHHPALQPQRSSPKRRRLCSESVVLEGSGGGVGFETATSRFFSKQAVHASPSLRKASSKKDSFELWTDEPKDGPSEGLPPDDEKTAAAHTPSPKKRKRLQVYQDPPSQSQNCNDTEPSQSTLSTTKSADSQVLSTQTSATSFDGGRAQDETTVFTAGINANLASLKSRFNFVGGSPPGRTSLPPHPEHLPEDSASASLQQDGDANKQQCNPQQFYDGPDVIPASSPVAAQHQVLQYNADTISDEEWLAVERQQIPAPEERGSEDLLVPNSPDSREEEAKVEPRLDFGRFVFTG
jgi:exonuclease 1